MTEDGGKEPFMKNHGGRASCLLTFGGGELWVLASSTTQLHFTEL
jgi:hypothetical protein